MQLVNSLYMEPKEEFIMGSFLKKSQLPALVTALRIAASSVKKKKRLKRRQEKKAIMEYS